MSFAVYVTGTDTGIGKTVASCALLQALRSHGLRVAGMKPVASGCRRIGNQWRNDDALALQAASDPQPRYDDVNPYALPDAVAPELAAQRVGIGIDIDLLLAAHARLAERADALVVEGVGGWMAPLSGRLMQADVVRLLRLPVVLVVGLRLGCINHALLTARAVAADGAHLAGWIASTVDPDMDGLEDNVAMLRARMPASCWGVLPHRPDADARALAAALRLPMLAG